MTKKLLQYGITSFVGLVIVLGVLLIKGTFAETEEVEIWKDLCDGVFVSAVFIMSVGLLVIATRGGTFDMIKYAMIRFFSVFKRDVTDVKFRTFYEYRKAQQEKKPDFIYLLIVGAVFLIISFILLAVYLKIEQ